MKQLILARCTTPPLRYNTKALVVLLAKVFIACLVSQTVLAAPIDDFVTTWKTDNPGPSNNTSIIVPMKGGPYDVDWNNDGDFDEFGINGTATHDYMVAGTYTIRIRGSYDSIQFAYYKGSTGLQLQWIGDGTKIYSLDQWGTNPWTSFNMAFMHARNLRIPAMDTPNLSACTDMAFMFEKTNRANPDVRNWDVSAVTSMHRMFKGATVANPDVSGWDVSAVTSMHRMFKGATAANPDVSGWDTSAVINMSDMFSIARSANPDVSSWDTSAVTDMESMFSGATSANPDVSGWDTSAVTNMMYMFNGAYLANPDVSGWDTSAVTNMQNMFSWADLANPDVSNWDTSAVTNMGRMFLAATSFNQNLGSWDVTAVKYAWSMFAGVTLSPANYEGLLVGWSTQELNSGVHFDGGDSIICSADAAAARERMITDYSWRISDGGLCRPTGVRATDGDYPNHVQISFSPVDGATVYRVYRCPDNGYTCGLPIGYVNTPTFNDTKGNSEQVYYYRVRACMASGCSKFSVADTGFTAPAPDRPTEIRASDGTFEDRVQITFNPVERATVYRVFRCPDRGYTCGLPIGYPKTGTFEDRKGDAGTVYFYRVRACTATTCGKFSVVNAGHRAAVPVAESDESKVIANAVPGESLNDVPIPSLNEVGRWLLILMTLGIGLLLINRRNIDIVNMSKNLPLVHFDRYCRKFKLL